MVIEIRVNMSGEIATSWWSEELKKLFCAICGKHCTEQVFHACMVQNPYCG